MLKAKRMDSSLSTLLGAAALAEVYKAIREYDWSSVKMNDGLPEVSVQRNGSYALLSKTQGVQEHKPSESVAFLQTVTADGIRIRVTVNKDVDTKTALAETFSSFYCEVVAFDHLLDQQDISTYRVVSFARVRGGVELHEDRYYTVPGRLGVSLSLILPPQLTIGRMMECLDEYYGGYLSICSHARGIDR